ncbi:Monocopper oxidase-like protein SKS1 [Sesamum alatum]|uniref:Monocopper oxidase-like protein SKS1 n=1 Tax=Sesamum alatum TaxID=300844 RepID=A0AAE1YTT4_9LAMI|nr:Monocopper oxidase-like protein SKS1 [Sesamum alatum]
MISGKHRHHKTVALRRGMWWLACCMMALSTAVQGEEVFLEWHVKINNTIEPVTVYQPDQLGGFHYFPTLNFQRAGGGFGPIRINNRIVINVPFPKPEQEFDLLIGDWFPVGFKEVRASWGAAYFPRWILMNGKGPYLDPFSKAHESFNVLRGKTYRFRIANVGNLWSINFRIQNHKMLLVETEGSYTNQIALDSLDVHVGQSYSVLVTADQYPADYYIVATPKWVNFTKPNSIAAVGLLHYDNSTTAPNGPLPNGPDPFDIHFSLNQAQAIT